jgi:nitrate/nitrite-specific signal transduction histidine kinase
MAAVQSYRLDGEYIQGRLFCFGKRQMHVDDLIVGNLVARLTVSELDSLHLVTHMGESAISEERLRVARDLHDSLAQSLAGTSLQLVAARRLLISTPRPRNSGSKTSSITCIGINSKSARRSAARVPPRRHRRSRSPDGTCKRRPAALLEEFRCA